MRAKFNKSPLKPTGKVKNKGRCKDLLNRRDIKLMQRFYHLTEVQRRRFDDVVHILSTEEFFISEQRVWWIIKKNLGMLDQIKNGESIELSTQDDPTQIKLFD